MNYLKIVLSFLLLFGFTSMAQSEKELAILKADTTWGKEIITFPVEWAPKMSLTGFEELRFAPGWSDVTSNQFWTYVLAWKVESTSPLSIYEIERNLEAYFDGLMKPNHWAQEFPEPLVVLSQTNLKGDYLCYEGKMKFFDGFHKGVMMTNHAQVQQYFNREEKIAIVIFKFSPKPFNHEVWRDLESIQKL